jgi:hypothetical protein
MLPKLDASAPYRRGIFGGRLGLYTEKIAEKSPVGFDSKKDFTEVDEDRDLADRVRLRCWSSIP